MDSSREALSALVDGELDDPGHAIDGLLNGDSDDRRRWSRYHLVGEILRNGGAEASLGGLDERIRSALLNEPHLLGPMFNATRPPRRFLRLAPALAASLAAIGVVGVLLVANAPGRVGEPEVASTDNASLMAADWRRQPVQAAADTAELRRRLNSYIVNFNEQRDNLAVPNVHPYVRIVGFEKEPLR